jgi:hypothetical protein
MEKYEKYHKQIKSIKEWIRLSENKYQKTMDILSLEKAFYIFLGDLHEDFYLLIYLKRIGKIYY